jgi:hypothetical protein
MPKHREQTLMMSFCAAAAWAALSIVPCRARASMVGTEVGIVADYRPVTGRFFFNRAGERDVPVRVGAVVSAGDQITLPSGASVTIQLGEGRTIVFQSGTSVVPDAPSLPNRLAGIYHSLSAVFAGDFRQSRIAASRGGTSCAPGESAAPIAVPVLVAGATVAAGTRDLPIVWSGGCAPFVVALLRGSDTVAVQRTIESRQTRMNQLHLVAGRYRLHVTDATGQEFDGILECVVGIPSAPEEVLRDTTALGVIAQSVWLAQFEGGRWRYDSFERLRPLVRQRNPLAGAVADWILWGRD